MKVLVSGSRRWTLEGAVFARLCALDDYDTQILVGDCPTGVDSFVMRWRDGASGFVTQFKADWDKHGKAAGPIRNLEMFAQNPDFVIVFRKYGLSRGSDHVIEEAKKRQLPLEVYYSR
mgnify:CR=1 FL=1